jgi:hypothetical protein
MPTVTNVVTPQTSVAVAPAGDDVAGGTIFLGVHHRETSDVKSDDII